MAAMTFKICPWGNGTNAEKLALARKASLPG